MEDIAEEIPFISFSPGALHFPAFVPVGLIKQKQRMLNNPHASSSLGPRSSQILHVFKDLKHAIIIKHVVLIVCGQLTNLILCNTFYVTFLFPLETLHILTLGMASSGVDWTC